MASRINPTPPLPSPTPPIPAGANLHAQVTLLEDGKIRIVHKQKTYAVQVFDIHNKQAQPSTDQWKAVAQNVVAYLDTLSENPLNTLNPRDKGKVDVFLKDDPSAPIVGVHWEDGKKKLSDRAHLVPPNKNETLRAEQAISRALSTVRGSTPSAVSPSNPSTPSPAATPNPAVTAASTALDPSATTGPSTTTTASTSPTTTPPVTPTTTSHDPSVIGSSAPVTPAVPATSNFADTVSAYLGYRRVKGGEKKQAATIIAGQLSTLGDGFKRTITPKQLQKSTAEYIINNLRNERSFAIEDKETEEMADFLKQYRNEAGFIGLLRGGVTDKKERKIPGSDLSATNIGDIVKILAELESNNKQISDLNPTEKQLIAKAFANVIHNNKDGLKTHPSIDFRAMHAFLNEDRKNKPKNQVNLVIVEVDSSSPNGYKIVQQYGDKGLISGNNTVFVLHRGGNYLAFFPDRGNNVDRLLPLTLRKDFGVAPTTHTPHSPATRPINPPRAGLTLDSISPTPTTPTSSLSESLSAIVAEIEGLDETANLTPSTPPATSSMVPSSPSTVTTSIHPTAFDEAVVEMEELLASIDEPIIPRVMSTVPASQPLYRNVLSDGDCLVVALLDQQSRKEGEEKELKTLKQASKAERFAFSNKITENIHTLTSDQINNRFEKYQDSIDQAKIGLRDDIISEYQTSSHNTTLSQEEALKVLEKFNTQPRDMLDLEEKKHLLVLFAWHIGKSGRYLDENFLEWFAFAHRTKIAVVSSADNQIIGMYPRATPGEQIKKEDYLFVQFIRDGHGHYQSINRDSDYLTQVIETQDQKNAAPVRQEFQEAWASWEKASGERSQELNLRFDKAQAELRNKDPLALLVWLRFNATKRIQKVSPESFLEDVQNLENFIQVIGRNSTKEEIQEAYNKVTAGFTEDGKREFHAFLQALLPDLTPENVIEILFMNREKLFDMPFEKFEEELDRALTL